MPTDADRGVRPLDCVRRVAKLLRESRDSDDPRAVPAAWLDGWATELELAAVERDKTLHAIVGGALYDLLDRFFQRYSPTTGLVRDGLEMTRGELQAVLREWAEERGLDMALADIARWSEYLQPRRPPPVLTRVNG